MKDIIATITDITSDINWIYILYILSIYGFAFYKASKQHQSTIIFWVYLAIHIFFSIWYLIAEFNPITGSDAMGNAMENGFRMGVIIGFHIIITALLSFTFIFRLLRTNDWCSTGIFLLIVAISCVLIFVDYRYALLSLTPVTNENKLVLQDGIMYTSKNKEFTGTAIKKNGEIPFDMNAYLLYGGRHVGRKGKNIRITKYKNGLKDGKERIYHCGTVGELFYSADRTFLYSVSQYSEGLKNGKEKIYDNKGRGYLDFEAYYKDGEVHGLFRSYYRSRNVAKEVEYSNGEILGFYRTFDSIGDTLINYISVDGRIIEGCRLIKGNYRNTKDTLEWYENGQLLAQRVFEEYYLSHNPKEFKKESLYSAYDPVLYKGLFSETYYQHGEAVEYTQFNNGEIVIYSKQINGIMTEIFNSETGVDKRSEYGFYRNMFLKQ